MASSIISTFPRSRLSIDTMFDESEHIDSTNQCDGRWYHRQDGRTLHPEYCVDSEMNYQKLNHSRAIQNNYVHDARAPMYTMNHMYSNDYLTYNHMESYPYMRPSVNHYATPIESNPESTHSQSLLQKLELTGRVPSREKFRRMICQTYICCGGCPYNERCVFIHDDRIELRGYKTRPNKQTKSYATPKDSFFWPDMQKEKIWLKLDYLGLPSVSQPYEIPVEFINRSHDYHDRAIFSMWAHFVAFCYKINHDKAHGDNGDQVSTYVDSPYSKGEKVSSVLNRSNLLEYDDPESSKNKFVPTTRRLPIFVSLCSQKKVKTEYPSVKHKSESIVIMPRSKHYIPDENDGTNIQDAYSSLENLLNFD